MELKNTPMIVVPKSLTSTYTELRARRERFVFDWETDVLCAPFFYDNWLYAIVIAASGEWGIPEVHHSNEKLVVKKVSKLSLELGNPSTGGTSVYNSDVDFSGAYCPQTNRRHVYPYRGLLTDLTLPVHLSPIGSGLCMVGVTVTGRGPTLHKFKDVSGDRMMIKPAQNFVQYIAQALQTISETELSNQ